MLYGKDDKCLLIVCGSFPVSLLVLFLVIIRLISVTIKMLLINIACGIGKVKNPMEENEVVGITNYIDVGFELKTRYLSLILVKTILLGIRPEKCIVCTELTMTKPRAVCTIQPFKLLHLGKPIKTFY